MHTLFCKSIFPCCLCLTCKKDSDTCCVDTFPDEDCFVTACDSYEKEDE